MATWLITGISRGLGLALAQERLQHGDTVIGTVRHGEPPLNVEKGTLHLLQADLGDPSAAVELVQEAYARVPVIDVIVNNAGYGLLGALETSTDEEMRQLFEVDVFAPVRLIRAALPHLRRQGHGHIVNVTSIAGRAPGTGSALYCAAKGALEALTAALAQEVAPLGIKLTAVAPGAFRTDFLSEHSIRRSGQEDAAYAATVGHSQAAFKAGHGQQTGDPAAAARAISEMVSSAEPPLHLLLGSDALGRARAKLDTVLAEMETWRALTCSTDFGETTRHG
ncbi:SDR family NAD(P)-dependent oxidoreductase [Frateuria aurantia]